MQANDIDCSTFARTTTSQAVGQSSQPTDTILNNEKISQRITIFLYENLGKRRQNDPFKSNGLTSLTGFTTTRKKTPHFVLFA